MINLLPISGIKRVISEYRIRLTATALVMLATTMIIAIILLVPAYLLASHKQSTVVENLSKTDDKKTSFQEAKNLEIIVKETDTTIDLLNEKGKKFTLSSDLLQKTAHYKTEDIKIRGIFYNKTDIESTLSLKGMATNRQSLTNFVEILKKDAVFKDVSLPISDLVKDKNIDFTVMIKYKDEENEKAKKKEQVTPPPPEEDEAP